MRAHLNALKAALTPLGYPVHLFYAAPPGEDADVVPPVPYLVLGGAWGFGEAPVCGRTESLDTSVTVICAASTAEGADVVAGRVRSLLSPDGGFSRVPMAGRVVEVKADGFTEATVDRDLRLPNSNRHPGVAHVLLQMYSDPA